MDKVSVKVTGVQEIQEKYRLTEQEIDRAFQQARRRSTAAGYDRAFRQLKRLTGEGNRTGCPTEPIPASTILQATAGYGWG